MAKQTKKPIHKPGLKSNAEDLTVPVQSPTTVKTAMPPPLQFNAPSVEGSKVSDAQVDSEKRFEKESLQGFRFTRNETPDNPDNNINGKNGISTGYIKNKSPERSGLRAFQLKPDTSKPLSQPNSKHQKKDNNISSFEVETNSGSTIQKSESPLQFSIPQAEKKQINQNNNSLPSFVSSTTHSNYNNNGYKNNLNASGHHSNIMQHKTAQFEKPSPSKAKTFVFDPYKYKDGLIDRDTIQGFLDTFVNERGESLKIQFGMEASGYFQAGWFPAYLEVGLSTSFAYEKMQDFTYLLSGNIDVAGKVGLGKATKKNGKEIDGATGIGLHAGYSYQWEFANSRAVAGSIYNHLLTLYQAVKRDEKLTEEQKQDLLIPLKGTDYQEAGAKKELEVVTLGGGVFAKGNASLDDNKGGGASVEANWSSSKISHHDKQDTDNKKRTSQESSFAVNGELSFDVPWLGGTNIILPASLTATTVVGDPNVNMNGKYLDFTFQPTIMVKAEQIKELLETWSTNSGSVLSKAAGLAAKMPGFGDLNTAILASVVQIIVQAIPGAGSQIKSALPQDSFKNSKSKFKIAPKVSFKWRQQEASGKKTYELMRWGLAMELAKIYGASNEGDGKADMKASIGASTTFRVTGGLGDTTLYYIRQTYIDAPEDISKKKPGWESFKNSNKGNIASAIFNTVYNNGRGPQQNSSAGSGPKWMSLFNNIKAGGQDKKAYCMQNADGLIKKLEGAFDEDNENLKGAEVNVRDFVDLLSNIKSEFITSSKTLNKVIDALKEQYDKGGKQGVKNFLELTASYGIDPIEIIQIIGPHWGRSAKSWFDKWGIPYKSFQQRATEPKLAQYERMAKIVKVRLLGNKNVLYAMAKNATFGYEGEISSGDDGHGVVEIFRFAENDSDFKEELKLDSITTILKANGFKYALNPVMVLVYFLEKEMNLQALLKSWESSSNWEVSIYRMELIEILGRNGYSFGIRVISPNEDNKKFFSYIGYYQQMAAKANSILVKGYSFFTGYPRVDQFYFFNLIDGAARDVFLMQSLKHYKTSYPDTETDPLRWLWPQITRGASAKNINYMVDRPPYMTISNKPKLRNAGIDWTKGENGIMQKKALEIASGGNGRIEPNDSRKSSFFQSEKGQRQQPTISKEAQDFSQNQSYFTQFESQDIKPEFRAVLKLIGKEPEIV